MGPLPGQQEPALSLCMERHAPSSASYPNMARELLRTAEVCRFLSGKEAILLEPAISRARCEEAAKAALTSRTMGDHKSVVIEALSSLMLSYIEEVLASEEEADEDRVEELRNAVFTVRSGTLLEKLSQAWENESSHYTLDEAINQLDMQGWGGQDLCWAVITFETHRHINLVWHQANKLERSFPDRHASDLFGWGWVGLRTALRNYRPELGFTFSTYACTRIAGTIRDGVRSENPIPKRLTTYARKVAKAEEDLTQSLGRQPSLEEVADHLGEDLDSLAIMPRLAPAASVDEIIAVASEHGSIPNWLVDSEDPAELALASARAQAIENAMECLPKDDRDAVRLLVMEALTPTEARMVTGATARQMRQRRERGLAALRATLEDWAETEVGLA